MVRVPQLALRRRSWPVSIEDDLEVPFAGSLNHLVHDLQTSETLQVSIFLEVNPIRDTARIEQLVAIWQSDGVEAGLDDLVQPVGEAACPQPLWGKGARLQAKPVDPGQVHDAAVGIDDV